VRVPSLELSKIAFSKGEMDERVKQMKLMSEVMNLHIKEVNERLERLECHLRRIDFTNEFIARAYGYKGIIHQDSNNSPRKIIRGGFE
jgi:hypothetical protein